jgi:hypothetical protein
MMQNVIRSPLTTDETWHTQELRKRLAETQEGQSTHPCGCEAVRIVSVFSFNSFLCFRFFKLIFLTCNVFAGRGQVVARKRDA